jgi:hypothetical protein
VYTHFMYIPCRIRLVVSLKEAPQALLGLYKGYIECAHVTRIRMPAGVVREQHRHDARRVARKPCLGSAGNYFSNVPSIVTLYTKYTRAMTFEICFDVSGANVP